jgi:hypothetical protein
MQEPVSGSNPDEPKLPQSLFGFADELVERFLRLRIDHRMAEVSIPLQVAKRRQEPKSS